MTMDLELGKNQLVIDLHIEDALAAGDQAQIGDVMLQFRQNLSCHAHGVTGVVSRKAVGDGNMGFGHSGIRVKE